MASGGDPGGAGAAHAGADRGGGAVPVIARGVDLHEVSFTAWVVVFRPAWWASG